MLPLKHRLPLRTTRRAVEAIANPYTSVFFTFLVAPTGSDPSRFAVILSKKISGKAVVRNLLRRQILSSIQELLPKIKPGFDAIILPKKTLLEANFSQIKADIESLLKKSGLI